MENESNFENIHERVFNTYQELQKMLPKGFLKMKVLKKQKFPVVSQPILKMIENDEKEKYRYSMNNKNKNYLANTLNKNIYLYTDGNKEKKIISRFKSYSSQETNKDNNFNNNNENNYNSIHHIMSEDEINEVENENEEKEFEEPPQYGYAFHPHIVKDADMKNNVYLPSIIDRMKYTIPRNERDKKGYLVKGVAVKNFELADSLSKGKNVKKNNNGKMEKKNEGKFRRINDNGKRDKVIMEDNVSETTVDNVHSTRQNDNKGGWRTNNVGVNSDIVIEK